MNKYQILNERFQLAVSSANIGIWDLDVLQNKLVWDEQICNIYGIQAQDFSGGFEAWRRSLHSEDTDRAHAEVQSALHGERKFDTKFHIVRPDGNVRHIKASARVINDEKGRPVRMTGINYDITDEKHTDN